MHHLRVLSLVMICLVAPVLCLAQDNGRAIAASATGNGTLQSSFSFPAGPTRTPKYAVVSLGPKGFPLRLTDSGYVLLEPDGDLNVAGYRWSAGTVETLFGAGDDPNDIVRDIANDGTVVGEVTPYLDGNPGKRAAQAAVWLPNSSTQTSLPYNGPDFEAYFDGLGFRSTANIINGVGQIWGAMTFSTIAGYAWRDGVRWANLGAVPNRIGTFDVQPDGPYDYKYTGLRVDPLCANDSGLLATQTNDANGNFMDYSIGGNLVFFSPMDLNAAGHATGSPSDALFGWAYSGIVWWDGTIEHAVDDGTGTPVAIDAQDNILALTPEGPALWQLVASTNPSIPTHRLQLLNPLLPLDYSLVYVADMNASGAILATGYTPAGNYENLLLIPATIAVDADRDSKIKLASEDASDATSAANPFRFWINDDNDSGEMGGDDVPGRTTDANYADNVVNGTRDLVDFFPVFLDIKQLLTVLPPTTPGVIYKLKQAEGALNFFYTNLARETTPTRDGALAYQKKILSTGFGPDFAHAAGEANTQQITAAGIELSSAFLTGVKDSDWGVILIEGRATTSAPLVLSVEKDGTVIAEVKLELRISNVENMFRHVDLAQVPKKYDGSTYTLPAPVPATHTDDPGEAWSDIQTNGKYFVFVHGFNIDGQRARGWNSEVFKRLHVLGSKARFVGVSWHGATGIKLGGSYTDYHGAVFNAFQTGDALAGALSFTGSADVTIAAHSLGNIVASQAIQSGGFAPTRYYMINCAVPIEAYDLPNVPDTQITRMTESKWKLGAPDNRSTYAANWHQLFDATPSDHRGELKWKNRFSEIFQKTVSYDFYSAGDDVVEDPEWDSPSVLGLIFAQGFNFSRGAWVTQEFAKGANVGESLAVLNLSRVQGGWGESVFYTPPWGIGSLPPSPDQTREPYFGYFREHDLFDANPAKASAKAGQKLVQYDLLARGLPALSFAVAANKLIRLEATGRNFDMEALGRDTNVWPIEGHTADGKSVGRWLHSDFKNVALPYVHKMYEEMINRGSLK